MELLPEIKKEIQQEIAAANGNEVFLAGRLGTNGVERVQVLARGNKISVPAIAGKLAPGMLVIHNHPSGELTPSQADIEVAARFGRDGVGFAIIDNQASKIYVVVEPHLPEITEPVTHSEIDAVLGNQGSIATRLAGFQTRPQQLAMARTIGDALNEGAHALVEAATGTGKSLAYLVPALLWANANNKRVVVSTNTINLQEQLIEKDIPLLQKAIPEIKAVLVKGRGNYLCLRKFLEVIREGGALVDDRDSADLQNLVPWADSTQDGSRSDLNFTPRSNLWELICSDGDTCLRIQCSEFNRCFFHRARRQALDADLLVANHHLLFADISLRAQGVDIGVMPAYDCIILDEAHNVEAVATTWFGARVTGPGITRQLSRLYASKGNKIRGLLPLLERKMLAADVHKDSPVFSRLQQLPGNIVRVRESIAHLFSLALQMVDSRQRGEGKLRLTATETGGQEWQRVAGQARLALQNLNLLIKELTSLLNGVEDLGPSKLEDFLSQAVELGSIIKRLTTANANLSELIFEPDAERVRWLEAYTAGRERRAAFVDAPLSVAKGLEAEVWRRLRTTVLTSATLAVDGDFSYIRQRLGLESWDGVKELVCASPFDYRNQVLLGVPSDVPAPDEKEFASFISRAIEQSLLTTQGRALVLFTSFSLLRKTAEAIGPAMSAAQINLLCQGELPRGQLLSMFRSDVHSALLATASFWEGVDVIGESLSSLIITRLPFTVPDEPVTQARVEKLAAEGKNPFYQFQVPQAVLRFKQGFGRLIRSNSDRGVVLLLDNRIHSKRYGRQFLKSLPPCPQIYLPLSEVLLRQKEFLEPNSNPQ
ncbi:MAG: DEAD/DEAH box helicase [Firmicutes bacterium]|nr:DEAD/DEAH box helicase [Bacillota bacterium]